MSGRVDEVQLVALAVTLGRVIESDRLGLDGDAAFALEFERVEDLFLHLAVFEAAADLDEAIGERGLAVVDVGNDREIADAFHQRDSDLGRPAVAEERRPTRRRQKSARKYSGRATGQP